ncbi:hypothetical protein ACIB15232_2009 [Aliarcobacter cibarius]|uniref:hypothetical protein n=1 Tax=Aliarcobacter cibarius TaxID=255507 RepID=UPI001248A4AE|nr:hypothetical protein [Aliarcobacter cibarius]QEZ90090.1 hypothetical protein ACIB15232_2009 [Aliarcobacter cibarius]
MPQLIAMIIIVVGAMIYMFQTFGGTGDKIEGIAQKASVITEINNIKNGLKLAARAGDIKYSSTDDSTTLQDLAKLGYFPEQINEQLVKSTKGKDDNAYNAISFGGISDQGDNAAMKVSLVTAGENFIPGIYVEFPQKGSLGSSAGFLESQVANDLKSISLIHRSADSATKANSEAQNSSGSGIEQRTPKVGTLKSGTGVNNVPAEYEDTTNNNDGKFIIYFSDFGSNEVVVKK